MGAPLLPKQEAGRLQDQDRPLPPPYLSPTGPPVLSPAAVGFTARLPSSCPSPLCTPRRLFRQFLFKIAEGNQQCVGEEKGNGDKLKKKTKHNNKNPTGIKTETSQGKRECFHGPGGMSQPPARCRCRARCWWQPCSVVQAPCTSGFAAQSPLPLPCCHPPTSLPRHTRAEGSLS